MSNVRKRARFVALIVAVGVCTTASAAQRTYVASSGNDVHPCSRTMPCRSFAVAVANTDPGGEVIVLDSAGYGPVTLAQSVSIVAPAGVHAGISVFNFGSGIVVDGNGIKVSLRGLAINGQGGSTGIHFQQGASLDVEDCEVSNLAVYGIRATAPNGSVAVRNSVLRDISNGSGFEVSGQVKATLERVHSSGNVRGVQVADGSHVAVTSSVLASNTGEGLFVATSSVFQSVSDVTLTRTTISDTPYGVYVQATPGNTSRVVSDTNVITEVTTAAFAFGNSGGTEVILSPGNNAVGFNNGIVSGGSLTTPCCIN